MLHSVKAQCIHTNLVLCKQTYLRFKPSNLKLQINDVLFSFITGVLRSDSVSDFSIKLIVIKYMYSSTYVHTSSVVSRPFLRTSCPPTVFSYATVSHFPKNSQRVMATLGRTVLSSLGLFYLSFTMEETNHDLTLFANALYHSFVSELADSDWL